MLELKFKLKDSLKVKQLQYILTKMLTITLNA
jgi:hypothetical protein